MIQEFYADRKLKKKVDKTQSRARLKPLHFTVRILWILLFLAPVVFVLYVYFGGDDDFICRLELTNLSRASGLPGGEIDHVSVIVLAIFCSVFVSLFLAMGKAFVFRFTGLDSSYRNAESLIYNNGVLEYGYRHLMFTGSPHGRIVWKISVNQLEIIQYNDRIRKFTLAGVMEGAAYWNFAADVKKGEEEYAYQKLILYDYFTPSLYEFLRQLPEAQAKISAE